MTYLKTVEIIFPNDSDSQLATITSPSGLEHQRLSFEIFKGQQAVRILASEEGKWTVRLGDVIQSVEVLGGDESSHFIQAANHHFKRQSGEWFYPFGTTVYAFLHQSDELIEQTLETLKASPFNKIRFCIFPKSYDYNQKDPKHFPFLKNTEGKWDVTQPDLVFWDKLDIVLERLLEFGIQADIICFHPYDRWGFSQFSQEDNKIYLDYMVSRLAAYPHIWWSLANEYDLVPSKSLADWEEIESYLTLQDPYHHLLSNHNCYAFWDFTRKNTTHASIQSRNLTRIPEWFNRYQKPIVIDECCYEGNLDYYWGSISGREMSNRFWRILSQGGYATHGETYADDVTDQNSIVWWSHGGKLRGSSLERIKFLKEIVDGLPGPLSPLESPVAPLMVAAMSGHMEALDVLPPEAQFGLKAFLKMGDEIPLYSTGEIMYQGRCRDEAFLIFYDIRTPSRDFLDLPETATYRVEVIDTWEMTWTVVMEDATGRTEIKLPNKEGMAVLAVKNN